MLPKKPTQLSYTYELCMIQDLPQSLVIAKTMVAAPKRQSISWLELFGAQLLAMLLTNVRSALSIDLDHTHVWSDSTFVATAFAR